jgi:hypothetical protein
MILFINGFELGHWLKHEPTQRYVSCISSSVDTSQTGIRARLTQGYNLAKATGGCILQTFQENKAGNVYSPVRDETLNNPMYMGKSMEYWNPVKQQISEGFKDNRLLFVNGSSDNRTTGETRFQIGQKIGQKVIAQWEEEERKQEAFNKKFLELGQKIHWSKKNLDGEVYNPSIANPQLELNQLLDDFMGKSQRLFVLGGGETLKIVGHSMGAAVSAGVADIISKSKYASRLEVVLYLAPHQPHAFKHPENIQAYQSSSKEDLIASKNDINMPAGVVFDPENNFKPVVVRIPVSIEAGKSYTMYKKIDGVQHDIIVNADHNGEGFGGHSVGTYKEEITTFFKVYKPR